MRECVFSAKGAAFNHSPPQDGFAVANLGQPRKLSGLKALFSASGHHCSINGTLHDPPD